MKMSYSFVHIQVSKRFKAIKDVFKVLQSSISVYRLFLLMLQFIAAIATLAVLPIIFFKEKSNLNDLHINI